MRELKTEEMKSVSGGIWQYVVAAYAVYEIANTVYEFGQGVVEGYKANDKV